MVGLLRWMAVCLVVVLAAVPAAACPFCGGTDGPTLTGEVASASMVLYGNLRNPNEAQGTTDLEVVAVLKGHKDHKDPKVVTLSRFIPVGEEAASKYRFLVYCDFFKNKVDPYRVLPVLKDGQTAAYLKGSLELKGAPVGKRLRFFFDYLDNEDIEISNDAYKEFAQADYKDYRDMAKELPADRVAKWLADEKTPAFRCGLYASMLGHCGTDKHAELLRKLLDDPIRRVGSGLDGILAAYVMLKPKEGWSYLHDLFKDEKKEFLLRYAGLRAARFLADFRTDLVSRKEVSDGVVPMVEQSDIADFVIDDLRKWQRWDLTKRVLALKDKEVFKTSAVRRAVLRFALSDKGNKDAEKFVEEQRAKDAEWVADVEGLLKLEQTPSPAPPAGK
jgi:hypothetical protein